MSQGIYRVTVIGAGTMGATIAGHLANAGIPSFLLDMVPTELTPEESAAGLTLEGTRVRNRIVQAGFERMVKSRPASLFRPENGQLITLGNLDDDFERAVSQSDWIIEVIVERPGPKQALMARIDAAAPRHAVISSNTSGIPIHLISQGRSPEFKSRFLGAHFFNPPRYLHLMEIIPTPETAPGVVRRIQNFAEKRLGKGVVICKDTPNFVANRMISFIQSDIMEFAIENGYSVESVDRLTGPLLGRPKSGTFRLNDIVGIDVMALVGGNLYDLIPQDGDRQILKGEYGTAVMQLLIENNLLGNKSDQGFYKQVQDGGRREFWGLDLQAAAHGKLDYLPPEKPRWTSIGEVRDQPLAERLRRMVEADDAAGELIWHTLSQTLAYASKRIPEIAHSIVDLDNAMKWGFGWELGPFETWDLLGVAETVARMEGEGLTVAPWVTEMVQKGHTHFYTFDGQERMAYDPGAQKQTPAPVGQINMRVADYRRTHELIAENEEATLLEMGGGVLLLEFHSKMNSLGTGIFAMLNTAIERLHGSAAGLVIGNDGEHFSAGANLFLLGMAAQSGQWDQIEALLKGGQDTLMALRQAPKPVVAAPFNMTLAGGVELCLAANRILAHAESYMGLVEFGVGIIPGWGGCKELVRRRVSPHMSAENVNPSPYLQQVFEQIGFAKVSTSAQEAAEMGYLSATDRIIMNRDQLLGEARAEVLRMAQNGYIPPTVKANVYAAGADQLANLRVGVYTLKEGGFISAHDAKIADKLAHVLAGGELSVPAWMDEQYFLDLEREAILSLAGEEKTLARIWYMLQNGKPLRN